MMIINTHRCPSILRYKTSFDKRESSNESNWYIGTSPITFHSNPSISVIYFSRLFFKKIVFGIFLVKLKCSTAKKWYAVVFWRLFLTSSHYSRNLCILLRIDKRWRLWCRCCKCFFDKPHDSCSEGHKTVDRCQHFSYNTFSLEE